MDKATQDLIASQSQVITMLALRISVLEKLLLDKKIVTQAEILSDSEVLLKEFSAKIQEVVKKAAKGSA